MENGNWSKYSWTYGYMWLFIQNYILNADFEAGIALYTGDTDVNRADINHF